MKVNVEKTGPCRRTLRIEIPAEVVSKEYDGVLEAFANSARLDGFRKGKAPRAMVARRYQKEITEEVRDQLIPRGYHEAIQQEKLDPIAIVDVQDVVFQLGSAMTFSVTLDVPPDFDLPKYKGMKLDGKKVEVADKDVEDAIQRMLEQGARWEEATGRPVQKGDLVQVDYEGTCEEKPIEELAPKAAGLGKGKDFWVLADENSFLPGFGEALVGASVGEKKQVVVSFDAKFVEPAVAGKKATYAADIKALREKKLPTIDAEFLKTINVESEEKLRTSIRDDLKQYGESMEKRRLKGEIIRQLVEHTKIDVPESVLEQEAKDAVYDIVRENTYRGVSKEQMEERKDEILTTANRAAGEKVKIRYILHRIAEEEKIEAPDEAVSKRIVELAQQYQMPADQFRAELERRNTMDNVVEEVRINLALDRILELANVAQS